MLEPQKPSLLSEDPCLELTAADLVEQVQDIIINRRNVADIVLGAYVKSVILCSHLSPLPPRTSIYLHELYPLNAEQRAEVLTELVNRPGSVYDVALRRGHEFAFEHKIVTIVEPQTAD